MTVKTNFSQIATKRREFIFKKVESPQSILEIGAFDNPTFRPEIGENVKYIDWFNHDELVEMHKANPRRDPENIVDIDFVLKSNQLSHHVPETFELICASHFIEHIADVIRWLQELHSMLSENGHVFLAIPDKRYTFDFFRNISSASEMVRAYEEKLDKPSKWQLVDHFYYHQKVDVKAIWQGKKVNQFKPRFSLEHAIKLAEQKASAYTDCHCWVFTSNTFKHILFDIDSAGLCSFEIEYIEHPLPQTNEFHVLLRKKSS